MDTKPHSNIAGLAKDAKLHEKTQQWMNHVLKFNYTYGFTWLGRPIIQQPQDIMAIQEIIWKVTPDLIIETGIAHGGSIIFYASMLELIGNQGEVVGIDIDIRQHNKEEITKHRMYKRIKMIEGSSVNSQTVEQVFQIAEDKKRIMVILDSSHTHDHVLQELNLYSPLVTKGSYLIVLDTRVEDMPEEIFKNSSW
ncbi:cephalosporin hydroxylase family protein, partial [Thermodesulfobacteriota bacterium]